MSMTFVSGRQRTEPTQQTVQSLLDENSQLIQAIVDYQNKGKAYECTQYQQLLHRNLVYLATLADSTQSMQSGMQSGMQSTIPAPGAQGGSTMKTPPASVTPPTGSGMLQPGVPDMTPNSSSSTDMMSNTPVMNSGMPSAMNDPMKSNMPPQVGGMSGPTSAGYGASAVSGIAGQSTSTPPQLQHPPMTVQSHMGYPNPSQSQPGRPIAPPPMSASMGIIPSQVPIQSHTSPMGQHMMSQNQQQSQQYMIQQRQIPYRQGAPQQMPQQQQSLSHSHPGYGPPTTGGMPSGNMIPGYPQQPQQAQRYNPYRQPPQQPGLSHMPYPAQQQPSPMQQGQSVMGQAPVGQSPMQQPPLV